MDTSLQILMLSAVSLGLIHTVIGPDHYLPFIVLGRAEGWTLRKTMFWTFCCGVGHVLSSIVLGLLGVALGWALSSMEQFESVRGQIASFALIGFGLLYFAWGLWRGRQGHAHVHVHADGSTHSHPHPHQAAPQPAGGHAGEAHDEPAHLARHRRTLWALFIIFVLGPCEPLIPLLMMPAAEHQLAGVIAVAGLFGLVTVGTMMGMVALGTLGVQLVRLQTLERYSHALAGFAILASGLLIKLFGL